MERSFGLRRLPPERLSLEGLSRRAKDRGVFRLADGAFIDGVFDETDEIVAEESTGSRDAGRGRPLGRGICVRSAIVEVGVPVVTDCLSAV